MSQVRIVDASYVHVPETTEPLPEPIKLTAMEALWIVIPCFLSSKFELRYSWAQRNQYFRSRTQLSPSTRKKN